MYKKACGATAGCTDAEHDNDGIIIKETTKTNLEDVDYSDFDIVKSVQYGATARLLELIDAGADVNLPDGDNISLLHWASINNRVEIVKLLLEKNAKVDAIGGDLNSTPLHWAVRQGHLATVVLLMNAGADPLIKDAEGCAAIHLAAQFGHTAVVAYLIARNVSPDNYDGGGMTALMWCSWKILSLDPVRLLLTLGANPNIQDVTHGNTALHWAILARNPRAIWSLIFKGKANIDIKNQKGDTPLQMLQQHITAPWIHYEVRDRIRDITQQRTKMKFLMMITMNERLKWWTLVVVPFVFIFSIALIISLQIFFILKVIIVIIFCAIMSVVKKVMLNVDLQAQLPLYSYWASKAFFYVSWAVFIWPVVDKYITILFIIANVFLSLSFLRLWKGDPGIIKLTHNQRLKTIIELSNLTLERGKNGFDPSSFCSACLVQKPLRSKHCAVCDRCVGVSITLFLKRSHAFNSRFVILEIRPSLSVDKQRRRRREPPNLHALLIFNFDHYDSALLRRDHVLQRRLQFYFRRGSLECPFDHRKLFALGGVDAAQCLVPLALGHCSNVNSNLSDRVHRNDHQRANKPRSVQAFYGAGRQISFQPRPLEEPG